MSYVDKLNMMSNDFKEYAKKHNVEKPDALTLVNFLREKNFTDTEIESTFAELGYPINMQNLSAIDPNDETSQAEKEQAIKTILSYVKKMNSSTRHMFVDILTTHLKRTKKQNIPKEEPKSKTEYEELPPKKGNKPHYKPKAKVESELKDINKAYIFESHSSIMENAVSRKNAERILQAAYETGKLSISQGKLFDVWKNSYSMSTDIQDLNRLISRAGIKMFPAQRIAKNLGIPIAKESDVHYAEKVANIVIQYGLEEEVLEQLKKAVKESRQTRQHKKAMSESDIRKALAEMLINENKIYMQ